MDISIIGLGNVGTRVLKIISKDGQFFRDRYGLKINVISVSDSKSTVYSEKGIDPEKILNYKANGDISLSGYRKLDFEDLLDLRTDCIVDLSAATADGIFGRDIYINAFKAEKNVVTANKAPLALHWKAIMDAARDNGRKIRYESTVAGGVPLFNVRDFSLKSSHILGFRGIVSSTVNYVLQSMLTGNDFNASVKKAQQMGIAEANYGDDTGGLDAARKTVILANSLFDRSLTLSDLEYEGAENQDKIDTLRKEGGVHRVVSNIHMKNNDLIVGSRIERLEENDPLLFLRETSLGYTIKTDNNGELFVAGLHDGPLETASGVVNDLLISGT